MTAVKTYPISLIFELAALAVSTATRGDVLAKCYEPFDLDDVLTWQDIQLLKVHRGDGKHGKNEILNEFSFEM
jgi:hypothetical protein